MKRLEKLGLALFVGFFSLSLALYPPFSHAKTPKQAFDRSIIVLANSSMTDAIHEISEVFSKKENVSLSALFESPGELGRLIEEGEAANVLITEDAIKMRDLQRLGALNVYSLANVAGDSLVVVAHKNHFLKKKLDTEETIEGKMKILSKALLVIPDPETDPAGRFIQQAFEKVKEGKSNGWKSLEPKMLRAQNTRNALYLIENGNDAGIIYKSDYVTNPELEILLEIPQEYYDRIIYQAAIVAEPSQENSEADSERFVEFLKSDVAKAIFLKHGFTGV